MPVNIEYTNALDQEEANALTDRLVDDIETAEYRGRDTTYMPRTFSEEYEEKKPPANIREIARHSLKIPDIEDAVTDICDRSLFDRQTVKEAISSLLLGHLMISGPPGTGKTRLAEDLARVFNAQLVPVTANPEWTAFDLIGSLTIGRSGATRPKDGHVTGAIRQCYSAIQESLADEETPQAVWLLIDEINRCEIDRAFGALFTALSGAEEGRYFLENTEPAEEIVIPRRFRIIAPLNTFDTRFVSGMSSALKRRFARVPLLPPSLSGNELMLEEFKYCLEAAEERARIALPDIDPSPHIADLNGLESQIRGVLGFLRGSQADMKLPVGPAQVIDCLSYSVVLFNVFKPVEEEDKLDVFDRSLATRLTSALESDRTRAVVNDEFLEEFHGNFQWCRRVHNRLKAFHDGRE